MPANHRSRRANSNRGPLGRPSPLAANGAHRSEPASGAVEVWVAAEGPGDGLFYGRGDSLQELTDAGHEHPPTAAATVGAGAEFDVEHAWYTLSLEGTAP
jgi:hypothetical protein